MELSDTQITILLGIAMVILLIVNFYIRKRRQEKAPIGMAVTLLSDLNKNKKLIENFGYHWQSKRFRTGAWQRNKSKIDFLPQELRTMLSNVFDMTEEFNQWIDAAKKHKSNSYMSSIELDKLKEPLARCQQKLREWLQENMNNPDYYPKRRRGLFG